MSPRDKTLRRVRQLLAATVSVGSAGAACGYGVVDPMPAPARCAGTAGRLFVRGQWEGNVDAGPSAQTLVIIIERPADVDFVIDDVTVPRGGVLLSKELGPPMVLKIDPQASTASGNLTVNIGVGCTGNQGRVQILALWGSADGGNPRPNPTFSVTDI